jgi:hypothetical protein
MNNSIPDFLLWLPEGRLLVIEFKKLGKKPTVLQTKTIERMKRLGYDVNVIDNAKDGKALIDDRMARFKGRAAEVDRPATAKGRLAKAAVAGVKRNMDRARRGQDFYSLSRIQEAEARGHGGGNAGDRTAPSVLPRVAQRSAKMARLQRSENGGAARRR